MSEHADRELVELARRGHAPAIAELFSRYWRAARAAAFGVTGEFASAEDAAAEAGSRFSPSGCVTAVASGNTVVYTLNDCTGPFGLLHVTGQVTAVFSAAAGGGLNIVANGQDLKANRATIDLDAEALFT